MVASNEDIRSTVRRYVDLVATGTPSEILALYAEDATVEDPVGSPVRRGHEEIGALYASLEGLELTTELLTLRACAGQAAFHFEIVTRLGQQRHHLAPLEVMTFDDAGKILSMRAFWSDEDVVVEG
ncbi:nuclear transport factor 2 family protein [Nocardioides sp. cx-173]|uniref:nuclear transport factor 2 family protein n=1 Tax=Nocardioides sp. cx-173 TaxID=2898796 RepID=UPI001E2BD57B|nr:nuclear transport factor 2 family protein [Nocardioides sp. cx-173]MCD4526816.1 nuclear transport factor 2 family protein [Nocardioides sp. cx-173]UGB43918.1 nuclear transport factor 2 family protein [Nocardioides sp. cx-173]